jgi:cobalt-zinc-cadmium efflux system membrane fusion protein
MINSESEILTIADLSTVWVDFQAPVRDVLQIETGQTVVIEDGHGGQTEGTVRMVSPTLNREGRTATVRVVLENPDGYWRPGMFVTGWIRTTSEPVRLAIPLDAIQQIGDESMVFVPEGSEFEPVPVVLGRRDRSRVEILSGLEPGSSYVTSGAFELKAMVITKSLGSHAGHGH